MSETLRRHPPEVTHDDMQDAHAAGGHDRHRDPSIVDHDEIDAVLFAAVQPLSPHGPRDVGNHSGLTRCDLPVSHVDVLLDARENVAGSLRQCGLARHHDGQRDHEQREEEAHAQSPAGHHRSVARATPCFFARKYSVVNGVPSSARVNPFS
jgi:hypothetical protein